VKGLPLPSGGRLREGKKKGKNCQVKGEKTVGEGGKSLAYSRDCGNSRGEKRERKNAH